MFNAEGAEVASVQDDLQVVTDDLPDTIDVEEAQPYALVA